MRKLSLITLFLLLMSVRLLAVGQSGMYQYSVALTDYISTETGKAPTAYLWIPDGCQRVKAVVVAQQNMTEETVFGMKSFQKKMKQLDVALLWVAPAFSQKWDPASASQTIFDNLITAIAYQAGHEEIIKAPIIPFGHSAQATFPWNFAAWNPDRTLCILSFHGDAPRTNLCGFGTSNVEWGRHRNIDGIPGLMVEGEYEWWEARVRPALAFRMMYPESCISFLADTGRGHFDCGEATADYMYRFIKKAMEQRMQADGTLKKLNPRDGWLAERYRADLPQNDGNPDTAPYRPTTPRAKAAPWADYQGDPHDAFWYFDREMAELTEARYAESAGKKTQTVGATQNGQLLPEDTKRGRMTAQFLPEADGVTFHLNATYTSAEHGKAKPRIEVINGPVEKVNENTFRIVQYAAGWDNPRRSFSCLLVAVADADKNYRGCVMPIEVKLPKDIYTKIK